MAFSTSVEVVASLVYDKMEISTNDPNTPFLGPKNGGKKTGMGKVDGRLRFFVAWGIFNVLFFFLGGLLVSTFSCYDFDWDYCYTF